MKNNLNAKQRTRFNIFLRKISHIKRLTNMLFIDPMPFQTSSEFLFEKKNTLRINISKLIIGISIKSLKLEISSLLVFV